MTAVTRTIGLALAALSLLPEGCGRSAVSGIVKAGGSVTYHKRPLANVAVTFHPKSGRPATGTTDAAGRFTLSTLQAGDGAAVGSYKVSICMSGAPPMPGPTEAKKFSPDAPSLPLKFSNPETSGLTANVEASSSNLFPFDLTD